MKLQKIYLAVCLCLLFATCKKDANNTNDEPDKALFELFNLSNDTYDKFHENAGSTNGNPWEAIMLTDNWLRQQTSVESTVVFDSTSILITTKAGFQSTFSFNTLKQDGSSQFRGSGTAGMLKNMSGDNCSNVIENKKVLIYAAHFIPEQKILDYFVNSDVDFEVTYLKREQCTPELLMSFKDYGLVILDTHGEPNCYMTGVEFSFSQGSKPADYIAFRDAVTSQIGNTDYNRLITGRLVLGCKSDYNPFNINWWIANQSVMYRHTLCVSGKFVEESPELSGTIVLGNFCWSGNQVTSKDVSEPIGAAFISKNPISYYAYAFNNHQSFPVSDDFSREMEDSLVRSLVIDKDSTGIAHLKSDNTEFNDPFAMPRDASWGLFYFKQFKSQSWCYGGCGDTLTDSRDQQEYATVCIGEQVWMAENLNWAGAGVCFDNSASYCNTYGRLYTWDEVTGGTASATNPSGVKGICPTGWHVPSLAEWQTLIAHAGGEFIAGDKLRANSSLWSNGAGTDAFGFAALPGGQCQTDPAGDDDCFNDDSDAYMWTASKESNFPNSPQYIAINGNYTGTFSQAFEYTDYFSCRCVKD